MRSLFRFAKSSLLARRKEKAPSGIMVDCPTVLSNS